jgi:hypothetical protein
VGDQLRVYPRSLSQLSAVAFPVVRLASSVSVVRRRRSVPTWMTPTAPRPNSAPVSQADRSVRRAALVNARVIAGPISGSRQGAFVSVLGGSATGMAGFGSRRRLSSTANAQAVAVRGVSAKGQLCQKLDTGAVGSRSCLRVGPLSDDAVAVCCCRVAGRVERLGSAGRVDRLFAGQGRLAGSVGDEVCVVA